MGRLRHRVSEPLGVVQTPASSLSWNYEATWQATHLTHHRFGAQNVLSKLSTDRVFTRDSICYSAYMLSPVRLRSVTRVDHTTRKLCYRKDDRAMRAI